MKRKLLHFCREEIDIIRPKFRNINLGYNKILNINPVCQMNQVGLGGGGVVRWGSAVYEDLGEEVLGLAHSKNYKATSHFQNTIIFIVSIILSNSPNILMRYVLLCPFCRWGNENASILSYLLTAENSLSNKPNLSIFILQWRLFSQMYLCCI